MRVETVGAETFSVEQARQMLLDLTPDLGVEEVDLLDSRGRILAQDAISDIDIAPFDNSAMDGFAVLGSDLADASDEHPVDLTVVEHIGAGDWCNAEITSGTVARIMTGAPVPIGPDAVVKVEDTALVSGDGSVGSVIRFTSPAPKGAHIRLRGEEVFAGQAVLHAGDHIGAAAIGLLASAGYAKVPVRKRPLVAILSTGSELVDVTCKPERGQIRNSNSYSISAQILAAGGIPVPYSNVKDTYEDTKAALVEAASECDFIVTSGGVSVGDFDYVKPVLEEIGQMLFCKVNMRPGNPQTMGTIGTVPFFGLPGNPVSTFVGFEMFVRPALLKMQRFSKLDRPKQLARITHDAKKRQSRRYFLRGILTRTESGELEVTIAGNQSSALLTSAHLANCLVVLPEGVAPVTAGSEVTCIRIDCEEGVVL